MTTGNLDVYRVRMAPDGSWFVMEHRDGRVEVYARLVGMMARQRAEKIAEDANRKERAA